MLWVIGVAIPTGAALAGWISYLLFCRFLVKQTKNSASLRDAAIAAKAYRAAGLGQFAQTVGKMLGLPRGGP